MMKTERGRDLRAKGRPSTAIRQCAGHMIQELGGLGQQNQASGSAQHRPGTALVGHVSDRKLIRVRTLQRLSLSDGVYFVTFIGMYLFAEMFLLSQKV